MDPKKEKREPVAGPTGPPPSAAKADGSDIPTVPWEALDHGRGHLQIAFHGQIYHLRVTRNGKLILTK